MSNYIDYGWYSCAVCGAGNAVEGLTQWHCRICAASNTCGPSPRERIAELESKLAAAEAAREAKIDKVRAAYIEGWFDREEDSPGVDSHVFESWCKSESKKEFATTAPEGGDV